VPITLFERGGKPPAFTATHKQSRQFQKSKLDASPVEIQREIRGLDDPATIVRARL
jgi:hypothetical protein